MTAVGPEAAGRLADLHARAFERSWSAVEFADLMDALGVTALEAEDGFILIRAAGPDAEVLTLAVAPEARRRGVGRGLVERALAAAAEMGADTMFLEVAADNAAALALYKATGFERAGVRRGYYTRPEGPKVDALTLRCALNRAGP